MGDPAEDHENMIELNYIILDACARYLKQDGNLLMKTFQGSLEKELMVHPQSTTHSR